jgi:hypothetical protein
MNFLSVIYHHHGAPTSFGLCKLFISSIFLFFFTIIFSLNRSVPAAFATRLINLFKEEVPNFYEKCEAAETKVTNLKTFLIKLFISFPWVMLAPKHTRLPPNSESCEPANSLQVY